MSSKRVRLWDAPTRLFHWSLAVLVGVSLYTGFTGGFVEMDYHMLSGYAVLALIAFRVLWGFVGSHYARFTTFVRGPGPVLSHLTKLLQKDPVSVGHNPLGALSVLGLLLVLLFQAVSGLFTNDDILLEGPLAYTISYDLSRTLTGLHKLNAWLIAGLVALHISAIAFYQWYRRDRVLWPMITGQRELPEAEAATVEKLAPARPLRELLVASALMAGCAAAVYFAINA